MAWLTRSMYNVYALRLRSNVCRNPQHASRFFETHECHFNDDGHRTAGSIHARDSVHDAEGLMRLHAELSATPHHPNSDGSSDESHEAYSSDSSYSSSDVSSYSGSSSSSESSYTRDDDRSGSQSTTSTYVKSTS